MTPMARIDDDGQVVATRLPRVGQLDDGSAVLNYPALPDDVLAAEGWRPLVDDGPPTHDQATERARRTGHVYDPDDDVVRAGWEIVDAPPPPDDEPGPGVEPDGHHDPAIGAPDA